MTSCGGTSPPLVPEMPLFGGAPRFGTPPRLMTSSGTPVAPLYAPEVAPEKVNPEVAAVDPPLLNAPSRLMTISGTPVAPFVLDVVPVVKDWPLPDGAPIAGF